MNNIYKSLAEIRKKWGVDAYDKICDAIWKQQLRIDELKKSRENWKTKYMELKDSHKTDCT